MTTPREVSLSVLMANSKHEALVKTLAATWSTDYAYSVGFHIYGDLSLNLHLSAAEDDANAQRYLEILQDYASIADACSRRVGAELLEVQGERIHLHLPVQEDIPTQDSIRRVLSFCISFTQTVYATLKDKADGDWGGFSMAADFGPAVLVLAECGGGSLVSLGPAANTPAKRLGREPGVPAGHCSVRREIIKQLFNVAGTSDWVDINVLEPDKTISAFLQPGLTEGMLTLANDVLKIAHPSRLIMLASSSQFADLGSSTVKDPIRIQGMCLRADLDGFTKDVQAAFASGQSAVRELVVRFRATMNYPRQFATGLKRPVIELPWAGDCAFLVLLPRQDEGYADVTNYLPVTAAVAWHRQQTESGSNRAPWSRAMGKTRWAIGVAGGDDEEGSDGVLLVANVHVSDRKFRVVAGWGARRSNDAYQANGVKADDSVIPNTDYQELDPIYQGAFSELDSRFMVAPYERLQKADDERVSQLGESYPAKVAGVSICVPAARPHWR